MGNQRCSGNNGLRYYFLILFVLFVFIPSIFVTLIKMKVLKFEFIRRDNPAEEINLETAIFISVPLFIFSLGCYILFEKKKNHHLINYRPILLCKIAAICSSVYNVILPLLLAICYDYSENYSEKNESFKYDRHLITLGFTLVFAPMSCMANVSRYVHLYLLNKRDISRMKLYSDKYSANQYQSNFEPNEYLKRLNKLVSRQITLTIFVGPYLIILLMDAIILKALDKESIRSSSFKTFTPIIFITTIGNLIIPYIFVRLYNTLNFINKMDLVLNFAAVFMATISYVSTLFKINGHIGLTEVKSPSLFFMIPSFFSYITAICIPLIEVYVSDRKLKGKKMIGKKEFTKLLMSSRYIDSLKSTAIKCYCVETVLFWDMHMKIIKKFNNIYDKKDSRNNEMEKDEKSMDIKQQQQQQQNQQQQQQQQQYQGGTGMTCNNISNPLPASYELLLGLNKNIFGNDNNAILYAGCNSSNNDLNQLTINRPNDPRIAYPMMNHYNGNGRPRQLSQPQPYQQSPYQQSSYQQQQQQQQHMMNMNSPGRARNYSMDHMNSYNNSNNDLRPSVSMTATSKSGNPYNNNNNNNNKMYSPRPRNDSSSQFSNQSFPNTGFLDSVSSEKVGLLYNSEPLDLTGSRTIEKGYTFSSGSSTTLVNHNSTTKSYNQVKKNPNKNSNTEIFYDIFQIDENHVELPAELWDDFMNLYYSFISDRSLATVNLDVDTTNKLKRALNNKNFTVDMFFPAISETVDLMYQNLYPKLLMK